MGKLMKYGRNRDNEGWFATWSMASFAACSQKEGCSDVWHAEGERNAERKSTENE